jgi:hypothetical protein
VYSTLVETVAQGMEFSSGRGDGQLHGLGEGKGCQQGVEALLGGEAAGVQDPQVAGGLVPAPGRRACDETVRDAPGDLLHLATAGVGGEQKQAVGHRAGRHHDDVGGPGRLAQGGELFGVRLREEEIGPVARAIRG